MKNKHQMWRRVLLVSLVMISCLLLFAACDDTKTPTVTEIAIQPNDKPQTVFVKGQDLDLSAGKLTVTRDDGTKEVIALNDPSITVTGYDKNTVGDQNLVIVYGEKSVSLTVSVVNRMTFSGFEKEYFVGDTFNTSKGSVIVVKNDGSKVNVRLNDAAISVVSFDSSVAGNCPVTIRYANGSDEYTDTLNVNVYNVGSIKFIRPTRTAYGSHETEMSLLGGYFQVTAEGNESLTKFVDLTQEMVTGFDTSVATKENVNTPVKQAVMINYAGQTYQFDISITYSGVSLMRDAIEELKDVQLDVEKPGVTEAQGKIALDALQEYMKLTPAERAKVEEAGTIRIARIAAMYGNAYANVLAQPFSKGIIFENGNVALTTEATREDVILAIEMLSDPKNEFVLFSKFLEEFAKEFAKVEVAEGKTVADLIKYAPEEYITQGIAVLEFMLQLHDDMAEIPDDWTVESLPTYIDQIDDAVRHIRNYQNANLISNICKIVSQWRAKDDYLRIIYTYYYNYESNMIHDNLMGQVPLPGDLLQMYSYFSLAAREAQSIQAAGQQALWADLTGFYFYYYKCVELADQIKAGDDTLCKDLYAFLNMDALIDSYVRYAQSGYINLTSAMYEDPEFEALMNIYLRLVNQYMDPKLVINFDEDKAALQELFDRFVAMTPAKQRDFMGALHYLYGVQRVQDTTLFSYPEDRMKGLFIFFNVSYLRHNLPDNADPIVQDLLLAMEYYMNNSNYDNAMDNFLDKMQSVIANYSILSASEKEVFDQYLGGAYQKYFKLYQINRKGTPSDLSKFEALRDELIQAVRDYETLRENLTEETEDGKAKIKPGMMGAVVAAYQRVANLLDNMRNHEDEQIRVLASTMKIQIAADYAIPADFFAQDFRWTFMVMMHNVTYTFKNDDGTEKPVHAWEILTEDDINAFWIDAFYVIWQQFNAAEEFDTAKVLAVMQAYRNQLTQKAGALSQFYTFDGDFFYYAGLEAFFGKVLTEGNVALGSKLLEVEKLYTEYVFSEDAEDKTAFMNAMAEAIALYASITDTENFNTYLADLYNYYLNLYNSMNTEA